MIHHTVLRELVDKILVRLRIKIAALYQTFSDKRHAFHSCIVCKTTDMHIVHITLKNDVTHSFIASAKATILNFFTFMTRML